MRKAQLTGTKPNAVDVEQVSLNVYPKNAKKITFASVFLSAIFWWCMGGSSSRNMSQPFIVNATAKHTATVRAEAEPDGVGVNTGIQVQAPE